MAEGRDDGREPVPATRIRTETGPADTRRVVLPPRDPRSHKARPRADGAWSNRALPPRLRSARPNDGRRLPRGARRGPRADRGQGTSLAAETRRLVDEGCWSGHPSHPRTFDTGLSRLTREAKQLRNRTASRRRRAAGVSPAA